jgi:phytoene dehydrogenase-like protein
MGALTGALADVARGFGAEIRTGAPVSNVIVKDERATGVRLSSGEEHTAAAVVSSADPRTTFHELLEPHSFDAQFMRHVRNIKYRGSAARIHLALRALPEFTSLAGGDATAQMSGPIQIAPSLDYVQKAFDCTKYGEYSRYPYLDLLIPTLSDPSLAPQGQHILSITAKYAPYALDEGDWSAHKQAFADVVIDTLAEYAPNIRDLITDQYVLTPPDLESRYGLPEGNSNHGEMTLDQFFHLRPIPGYARYRTPVAGMYLCGVGSHPGGGVTGIPGQNAAREILKDSK